MFIKEKEANTIRVFFKYFRIEHLQKQTAPASNPIITCPEKYARQKTNYRCVQRVARRSHNCSS